MGVVHLDVRRAHRNRADVINNQPHQQSMERLLRETRRRTGVVGAFPDGQSALMLAAARLRHAASTKWGTRRHLDMSHLIEMPFWAAAV